jgi:hypothetical protein
MIEFFMAALLLPVFNPGPSNTLDLHQTRAAQQNSTATPATPDSARIRGEIQTLEELLPRIPDRGAALFLLARRYAQLGESKKSLALLRECVSLDKGFDPGGHYSGSGRPLEPLKSFLEFQELTEQARRRFPPVHRARVAFTIQETDLFPEGLAVDPQKHVFYMGSMHRKKIISITEKGNVSDFVRPDMYDLMPVGGVRVEPADHSVWAATDPGSQNRSELVHFDEHGKLLERFPATGAGPHDLNDLVVRDAREIYLTDTFANQVYRFDRQQHTFTPISFPRPVFYPNGIALSDDENQLYVADILGVILLDLRDNTAQEVSPGQGTTLAGIDGLYWYKGSLVGVQYGTGSHRVMRWRLSPDGLRVTAAEILENRTPLVSFPTTGAIYRGKFYFISNTGIANLNDDKVVDPKKLEPINISVVSLE